MEIQYGSAMDILRRIDAYDENDGRHSDAVGGSAYDLMRDAANEIIFLRNALQQIARHDTDPVNLARKTLGDLYQPTLKVD